MLYSTPSLLFPFQRMWHYIFQKLHCVCKLYFDKAVCVHVFVQPIMRRKLPFGGYIRKKLNFF